MKIIIKLLLIAIFVAPILAFSQSNKCKEYAISVDKNNFFYIGMDNPVTIVVSGVEPKDVVVKIDNGTITRESNNRWTV
ncbi:MAG: hypothetical protein WCK02_11360 [Bacteroidota bacterium]